MNWNVRFWLIRKLAGRHGCYVAITGPAERIYAIGFK